jgi:hypothetical protein
MDQSLQAAQEVEWGEVISASSLTLEVECHQLYRTPPFGGFVRVNCLGSQRSFYAVVTNVSTGPFDGNRVVQAHRLPPGELEQKKPHLPQLLRSTFQAQMVGYGENGAVVAGTPPTPPRLHCFVYPATPEEVRGVSSTPAFLRPLTQVTDVPLEDLLVCAMKEAQQAWGPGAPLVHWGKFLARLLRSDYLTLEGVLQRLSPAAAVIQPAPAKAPTAPRVNGNGTYRPPIYEEPLPIAGTPPPTQHRDPFDF